MHDFYYRNLDFFRAVDSVTFFLADPGAAAVLNIFADRLISFGHAVNFVYDGWALETKIKKQMNKQDVTEKMMENHAWQELSHKNELLIYGARSEFEKNYTLVEYCQQNRLKTLFVFDSWKNYLVNFRDPDTGKMYLPDMIGVIDEYHLQGLKQEVGAYVDDAYFENVYIVGHPAIDRSIELIETINVDLIKKLKSQYNPQSKTLVLLVLEPIANDFKGQLFPGYDEYSCIDYFFKQIYRPHMRLIVKLHPRQVLDEIQQYISQNFKDTVVDFELVIYEKIEHLIAISDIIYGMTSIALIPAIKHGKQTISLQIGRNAYGCTLSNPYLEKVVRLN